ncbi:WD40 repeat domain-containing protein [Streptomyces sp. NPDC057376]|uniref:hypothetical protein n=1 Tax=unclassified Streptomyces TaxID=2593676 RepID=UPI00093E00EB|nr:hypothetical protein [Streptomyces sp. CB02414]OKI84840.1 hypothetical protein AMK11_20960 [Streptomyces sp. CB02414]
MRRSLALLASALLVGALAVPASAADGDDGSDGFTIRDPRITESSGLAASRLHPGVYWTHNDQDNGPYLYAVDGSTGETVARVALSGVGTPRDVEAISIGPGNKIFVGDIGDNLGGTWPYVWIYELPEPAELKDQTVQATQYVVKYADGARDAESMAVHPKTGRVYIIDKNENGGHLYEGPEKLSASGTNVFRRAAPVELWATDAAFSPDGKTLAVRGYLGGIWYDWNGGKIQRKGRISVPLGQGESVTYTPDGKKLLLGMEGTNSPVKAEDAPGGGSGGSGRGGSDASGGGDDGAGGPGGDTLKVGAVGLLVACAVLFGLRRVFRRR